MLVFLILHSKEVAILDFFGKFVIQEETQPERRSLSYPLSGKFVARLGSSILYLGDEVVNSLYLCKLSKP